MTETLEHEMKVRALQPWFGGKRTMAAAIVKQLGKHTQYFEAFCGSMAVLFAKASSQKETVNDLHCDLINLARVVADPQFAPRLYERLQQCLFSVDLLNQARLQLAEPFELPERGVTEAMLERSQAYFLSGWMGRNGTAGTARVDYQLAVRWTKSGGSPTVRWRNALDSLPAWHLRLQNVVIIRRNAFDIIPRFEDDKATAIYCDPPYHAATRSMNKSGHGSRYLHEFSHATSLFEQDEHQQLAEILRSFKHARIVVSYYDCPEIRELYDGWTIIDCARAKHLHAQNGRGARWKEAPEILIVNGPAYS